MGRHKAISVVWVQAWVWSSGAVWLSSGGRRCAAARTWSMTGVSRAGSRFPPSAPPRHPREQTVIAVAIPIAPAWGLVDRSAACPCPRSTVPAQLSCCCPRVAGGPAVRCPAAIGRSSSPTAATTAGWDSPRPAASRPPAPDQGAVSRDTTACPSSQPRGACRRDRGSAHEHLTGGTTLSDVADIRADTCTGQPQFWLWHRPARGERVGMAHCAVG